ncbi:SPRY domain-containing SOCS box protein 3 isoform X3 [Archocentrus centrarchus]|uniref:SPRY domain-containing SOCS box protein 3 isoform X3 n=1 Tax=Archocentrus centrarchus TaxID=63155 RepID=UPI0011EA4E78|nr:SPRY domain-containing SOCS box protein 3-like isoform X3 [Archocentrus centrarchus]
MLTGSWAVTVLDINKKYMASCTHASWSSAAGSAFHRTAMLRRGRNGRARHLAWSQTWQETDAMAVIHSSDREELGDQTVTKINDLESTVDYRSSSQIVSKVVALPCTMPVKGEPFCHCDPEEELSPAFSIISDGLYAEEDQGFDWVWDDHFKSSGAFLSCDNRKVSFHSDYSCGTAAIRGNKELTDGQHYWEIKMTSPVYGTDMMVGVGTSEVNLEKFKYNFGSLLGHDEDSWGLSYTGSIIGVHLDTWHGTLTFYKNRHCIGVAATRLQNKKFYPMVCSTAAKSSMKVIRACYTPTSLQYLCCARLRQILPCCPNMLNALDLPPGLRILLHIKLGWLFTLSSSPEPSEEPEDFGKASLPSSPNPSASPVSSACASPSPCTSPIPDTDPYQSPQTHSSTCCCPPTPPSSDYDSCCSEPEDYQCKRCRWT